MRGRWLIGLVPLVLSACGYNSIQSYDERANSAKQQIEVQLQRRADLVPNLVETVRGQAKQELDVFTQVARARSGLVESIQKGGVCAEVIAPAPGSAGRIADVAADIATAIAENLGVTGALAVEMFETTDERLLINELAMRPHNSGHWTIDGSTTSQFEQHLRAVLDLPLGATGCRDTWSVMVNVFGAIDLDARALADQPDVKFHGYGKSARAGRKVGHVTAGGDDLDDVVFRARAAAAFFED